MASVARLSRPAARLASAWVAVALLACVTAAPARAASKDPVARTLARLSATAAYPPEEIEAWTTDWSEARSAVRRLRGAEQRNVAGVIANTRSLADRGLLAGRARPAFLTVRNNLDWFAERRLRAPANGTRDGFGTQLVWQLYTGSGWQLQPLGTFGKLNALVARRRTDSQIRELADEMLALGVTRRGFLAFEYLFPWGGGGPGWISGMAQATGMQALAGAGVRLADPALVDAARRMIGAFQTRPPWGVRVDTAPGRAHFLLYSQLPRLLVGNGFAQALIGLDAYRAATGDPNAAALVGAGLAEARAAFPTYDTGAWSLYYRTPDAPGRESDLHYHELFAQFLGVMCARFSDPEFCTLQQRFAAYETIPVRITALRARTRGKLLSVTFGVSKRGPVKVAVWAGARAIRVASRQLLRGPERFTFARPKTRTPLTVTVDATSLTGLRSQARAAVPAPAPSRR